VNIGKIAWTCSTGAGWEYDDVWMLSNDSISHDESGHRVRRGSATYTIVAVGQGGVSAASEALVVAVSKTKPRMAL